MPQMNRDQRNAAWQAANQWRARAAQTQPTGLAGSLKLLFTWLAFGALMIVGVVLGLFFLLIGWAMMPFMRHKMKKRMEQMRAQQAQDIGGGYSHGNTSTNSRPGHQDALEGHYKVKDSEVKNDR
ncbi:MULTISPECIES: hypothetical protein [unclassified Halomonas]|jgi:hypothetical protein|uniref:hypothetical protein n=1 Tax=unclassified Halomonas TaxID=2609666 RepID=UPI00022D2AB4|nr:MULTISPECIES: hypothetical protein [unclassified Halomonas]EHA16053.1 hypothetical protein HAL1_08305 [Halomonas sp. HAL1]PKG48534.1 hypothetical protein CXF87_17690 [Halomonas sp. MES3-P3E]WKV92287.1 hypothetical protein Q3Y66_15700 [Halomonas sp. HAL1]